MLTNSRITQISSGSTVGNAYVYNKHLLIDIGVARTHLEPYLDEIKVIFISHVHGDHLNKSAIKSIAQGSPRYKSHDKIKFVIGEWLKEELLDLGVKEENIIVMDVNKVYNFGIFKLAPVLLYHDTETYGLRILDKDGYKAIYLSDTGHLEGVHAKDYDLIMIEYNHCEIEIKKRIKEQEEAGEGFIYEIGAQNIHLSMQKSDAFIESNAKDGTEILRLHLTNRYDVNNYDMHFIFAK